MLSVRDVRKSFGSTVAVESLTCEFPSNGVSALIGPSGCGKSTVLRMLAGLIDPDSGDIAIDDQPLASLAPRERAARIGYVIQEGGLFPHLTARRNAELPARHAPLSRRPSAADLAARLDELASVVHLTADQLARYPSELSGGQRQRVALLRALVLDPPVLLLDEPLGALDPVIRAELQAELKGLFSTLNKSVVFVTHDLAEAAYLADDIILLDAGRVAQRGSIGELIREPASDFVRTFVGEQIDRVRALLEEAAA